MRYIHFNEKDDLGWITRKKNLICENAQYDNIVILHDRIILDNKWYQGMVRFGNYFDVLSCKIYSKKNQRDVDWTTWGGPIFLKHNNGILDYRDWDKYLYVDGAFYILKKRSWLQIKWDETYYWNQGEDIKLSHEWTKNGIVIRFNQFSKCVTLSDKRSGKIPQYKYFEQRKKLEYQQYRPYSISCFKRDLIGILRHLLMKNNILNKMKEKGIFPHK